MIKISEGDVEIREARLDDLSPIEMGLRPEDKDEVFASYGMSAHLALPYSFLVSSVCLTILYKGDPVGLLGISPSGREGRACIWMVGTDRINTFKKTFVKLSRRVVDLMLAAHPILCNYVDARYGKAIKWLEHLGAEFEEPEPYGVLGMPFRYFEIHRR